MRLSDADMFPIDHPQAVWQIPAVEKVVGDLSPVHLCAPKTLRMVEQPLRMALG